MHGPDFSDRRARAAAAWGLDDEIVVIGAGQPIGIPGGADQCFPFRVHPDYFWLTGRRSPGGVIAFDPREPAHGGWMEFVPEVSDAERIWEGRVSERVDHDAGMATGAELAPWLLSRNGRPLMLLGAVSASGAHYGNGSPDALHASLAARLGAELLHVRRPKDVFEITAMRRAAAATMAGFARAREFIRPGVTEREIQVEVEAAMFRAGGERTAYDTIVGSGPNSAVLHFPPSARVVGPRDSILIDAGVEIGGYCADVTRVFAASGRFTPEQQALVDVVGAAESRAIDRCRAGVEWRAVHLATAIDLAEGLVELGLLRGSVPELVEREAIALFFPHGVGHMVGIGVRDAGGRLPSATGEAARCCGVALRVDLPLVIGYTMTVEPGLYLIPAILNDRARRERFAREVDWPMVDRWIAMEVGGVRMEDNVVVTEGAPEVLTLG